MRDKQATTATGTVAWVFAKAIDADRGVARLKAAGFGDVRLSSRSGTTTAEHVAAENGATASDFVASLEAAGFAHGDARALTESVANGGTLVTLAAGARASEASAVLRGETIAARPISAVDAIPGAAAALADDDRAQHVDVGRNAPASRTVTDASVPEPNMLERNVGEANVPESRVLELREERLDVRKERDEREARIRKEVVTEERTITVPVRREELVVERDGENDVRIPITDEPRLP